MTVQNQKKLDRTSRDFQAIRDEFIKPGGHLQAQYGQEYTEFRETETGMALIELVAGVGDGFNAACDRAGAEGNALTARETQSLIEHSQALGRVPRSQTPARHKVLFSTGYLPAVPIPKGTILLTNPLFGSQLAFELEGDVFKSLNATEVEGIVIAGRPAQQPVIVSTGDGKTRYKLTQASVIHNSVVVKVDGFQWTYVPDFVASGPGSTHFTLRVEEKIPGQRTTYVVFGNNANGAYPPLGSFIQMTYRVGGGSVSNVPLGAIDRFEEPIQINGSIVPFTIQNTQLLELGTDSETREQIRLNIPVYVKTNERLVSNSDYQDAALAQGAKRALAITNNESSLVFENVVLLFVATSITVQTTVNEASAFKAAITAAYPGRNTRRFIVAPCQVLEYTLTVNILLDTGYTQGTVHTAVLQKLGVYLGEDSVDENLKHIVDIGKPIYMSALKTCIHAVRGVLSVTFDDDDVMPGAHQLPVTVIANWTFNYTTKPYMYG